jgi:hypothetical protein
MARIELTSDRIFQAILKIEMEKHPAHQAWIDGDHGMDDVTVDGHLNLDRVAEILNED